MGQRRRFTEEYQRDAPGIVLDAEQIVKAVSVQLGFNEVGFIQQPVAPPADRTLQV